MRNEADTRAELIDPKLRDAHWDRDPYQIRREVPLTKGRMLPSGERAEARRADYLLCVRAGVTIAVVEAKPEGDPPGGGLSQALHYASMLGLRFAYATNGHGVIERDLATGVQRELDAFPRPEELWARLRDDCGFTDKKAAPLLEPAWVVAGRTLRYYQERAVRSVLEAIVQGRSRVLLTMATGTGKTEVAFQICWRLWSSRWNVKEEHRRPRILYLADRNLLVDDPKDKTFAPFGNALCKITGGKAPQGREMHFALYQSLVGDGKGGASPYEQYPRDSFDFIIIDECHRGSARADSLWRTVLAYFNPAVQLGLTATPLHDEDRDSQQYFGPPVYTYSLRQGIADGFLAPYRLFHYLTNWDAAGWRPTQDERDRFGRQIEDRVYTTEQFERAVALKARTTTLAKSLTKFLEGTDPTAKTIVFCVDQEHAALVRDELAKLNAERLRVHPDWVCRVTSDDGDLGRAHLSRFQDPECPSPVVLTTSQLLTTGVDAPNCRNVVLMRVVSNVIEFKQIIGRGTRLCDEYGKRYFNILDYTGTANAWFADPDFDGDPEAEAVIPFDLEGNPGLADPYVPRPRRNRVQAVSPDGADSANDADAPPGTAAPDRSGQLPGKLYVDDGHCEIVVEEAMELDHDGALTARASAAVTAQTWVLKSFEDDGALRAAWCKPDRRGEILAELARRGAPRDALVRELGEIPADVDDYDLLASVTFAAEPRTRAWRAARARTHVATRLGHLSPEARAVLDQMLARYEAHGPSEFVLPDALQVPPFSERTVGEYIAMFGGATALRESVEELQRIVYEVAAPAG